MRTTSALVTILVCTGAPTFSQTCSPDDLEGNKILAMKAIELWTSENSVDASELLAPDYVNHLDSEVGFETETKIRNFEAFKKEITKYHQAFTDVTVEESMQVAQGDTVATRVQLSAVHSGSYLGEKPTGKTIQYDSVEFTRIENCKVSETWVTWDKYAMFYQIGLIPED